MLGVNIHYCKSHGFQYTAVSTCFLTSDVNECRHYPGRLCAHKCDNILGSYMCSCTTGFKLASDGRNCDGKTEDGFTLIFS